jgi:RimJ/RimL family protein N-acetyltransferase
MLKIYHSIRQLNMVQLRDVYAQSILSAEKQRFPSATEAKQMQRSIEDFYDYVDFFLEDRYSFYAVWLVNDVYTAALRVERYRDGYLLSGLETAPGARGKGYATSIVRAVQEHLRQFASYKLYSHVEKNNKPSLAVHHKCGFQRISEHAAYIDGSVSNNACTLCYEA